MSLDEIQQCASGIPEAWYEHDTNGLHRVIETVNSRRNLIRDLITKLRESSRNPFPYWTD